ncbi:hypothetical protein BC827DRAFT_1153126 [Russula dissimulans]|nr:hypothetical protein BC827DRAFT_1153126 [Russula dissimulans]
MPSYKEKLSTPALRLEISEGFVTPSPSPDDGPSSSFRQRARALSNAASPPRRLSRGNIDSTTPLSPTLAFPAPPPRLSKARDESQKLLAHVLDQLRNRPKCPPSYPPQFQATPAPKSIIHRPSASRTISEIQSQDPESEEISERAFSPDLAFDLMTRLRDVLMISLTQGWQIFSESSSVAVFGGGEELNIAVPSSPFRRRRRTASFDSRHSSASRIEPTELLSQCISVLQSIVSEDCRYQLSPPRPFRPPNALQAISLDIARLLVHMHARSPTITSQVGFALLPAFVTFRAEMYPRLLLFFEDMLREHFLELQADDTPHPTVSIQVEPDEEVHTYPEGRTPSWTSYSSYSRRSIPSQNASGQYLTSYRLLSLISPLLAAISDAIDVTKASASTAHRLRHLLDAIITLRPDASLNVLEAVAYHTPKARPTALGILHSYWPRALGHCFISRPFGSLSAVNTPPSSHPHTHQFVLWLFTESSTPSSFEGNILRECRSCLNRIVGAGLFCPLCFCAVHFDCYDYPDGNILTEHPMELESGTQKVAVHRFCHVHSPTSGHRSHLQRISGHTFRVVNMFTLALCFICKQPLWGCHSQGLKCDHCSHFIHAKCAHPSTETDVAQCLTTQLTSARKIISPRDLRESFDNHFKGLLALDPDSIPHREETLICSDLLSVQLQILNNGLALGSIIIEGGDDASKQFSLELQYLLERFKVALTSQNTLLSDTLSEFFEECQSPSPATLLFDWSTIVFLVTSVKSLEDGPHGYSGDLRDPFLDTQSDSITSRPNNYDAVPLGLLRDNLTTHFQIHLDIAAEALLSQLHHVGLFELPEIHLVETKDLLQCKESLCVFALPLSLDLSANVETLITAIEACLSDIDLSVNEAGFLLLVRRVWPTEMSTAYALRRLMKSVLGWILAEYSSPWPYITKKLPFTASSNNGGDYVAHRRSLLKSYATTWLLALHDQDTVFYGKTCFDLVLEIAGETPEAETTEMASDYSPLIVLRIKAFKELMLTSPLEKPVLSLQRLLNRESNLNQRSSGAIEITTSVADGFNVTAIDPWGIVLRIASKDEMGLRQCLQWLNTFALSAVEIPESIFNHFKSLTDRFEFSIAETHPLIHATLLCVWMRSLGRQELLGMISSVHVRLSTDVSEHLNDGEDVLPTITDFIRLSLAACLLLAGCPRGHLIDHGMIMESEVQQLPSRRTVTRASMVPDPIHVDTSFILALGHYVNARHEDISVIVAKFLYLFVKECSLLEAYEVDNFILRNAGVLSSCHLSSICPNLLMRILVVDSQPLDALLQTSLSSETRWETRLQTLTQLFRIILDVINPSFVIEDRQWQLSATAIFYNYFTALIQDPQVFSLLQPLLPRLEIFYRKKLGCWDEALLKAPVSERVKLVSFLIRLHSLFSSWRVLSWDVAIRILSEEDYISDQADTKNESAYVHTPTLNHNLTTNDADIASLRGSLRRAVIRVLNLVPTGLSYELRQLSLTVTQTYIKLWPNTSGSLVLESIDVCSQVLTDLESNRDDPLASQATSFIEGALSMLMLITNQRTHPNTFFNVLRSCTENSARGAADSQGLRDVLLRDATSRIGDYDAESVKLVMHNLSLFIEKVHNSAYDPGLVRDVALCLTNVVRRAAEWPPESFDPGPLLLIISNVAENNPTQARDFLVYVDATLRLLLSKFIISQASLVGMLQVAKRLHLRIKKQTTPANLRLEQNRIMSVVLETCGEGLRRKTRIFPSTLAAMTEVFPLNSKLIVVSDGLQAIIQTSVDTTEYEKDLYSAITRLGLDGIAYLQTRGGLQGLNAETEIKVSLSIANLILYSWKIDADLINQLISEQPSEKSARQSSINVWNVLLLAALSHKSPGPGVLLMEQFHAFVTGYREALAASSSAAQAIVNASANINHCCASVKLWLLLERKLSQTPELQDGRVPIPKAMPLVIWNNLWPSFSDLLTAYEADVSKGQNATLWSATSLVIADLFHFLKEFHSILALETAVHESILNRLRMFGQPDNSNSKVVRALRTIREPIPRAAWTALLDQVKGNVVAAEKLDMMESRDIGKVAIFEKHRRESSGV